MKRMLLILLAALTLMACGGQTGSGAGSAMPSQPATGGTPDRGSGSPAAALHGKLTVFAAASLRKTFTELGDRLMADNPDLKVEFAFAGSSDLVTQLTEGAPADVFASADERNMAKASEAGLLAGEATPFATNHLTIITAPGNPLGISSLADLAKPEVQVVICAAQVPCGGATEKVAGLAGVTLNPVSEENSVSSVLTKVTEGQADAGLVYRTDARAAGSTVAAVDFSEADRVTNSYPIARLKDAQNAAAARAFIDLVLSDQGQQVLADAGFAPVNA